MKKRTTITTLIFTVVFNIAVPCFAAYTGDAAAESITLFEALRLTREHNPKALQAADELKAADAKVTQGRSGYFPQISAKAGYLYLNPLSEIDLFGYKLQFAPNNNYDARIIAEMMLFDFGRTSRTVDLAKSGKAAAGIRRDMTVRDLSLFTVKAFYSVLFLQEAVKVQYREIAALQQNLDHMDKRFHEGVATRFDLLTTQVRLSAAGNRRIDFQNQLDNQKISLRRLCGLKAGVPLTLVGSFDISAADMDADRVATSALENRPEIMLAREEVRSASYKKSLTAKESFPKIVATASYGTTNGYVPDIEQMRTNVSAGIGLRMPLFTGFRISASTSEATAMMHAAEQQRIDTEELVQAEVSQSVNSRRTSREKIGTTSLQVSQADLAARHARIRYQNGLATTLDLLDAEVALAEAELANLQARYEYVLNTYELRRAAGDLLRQ
ncbi:MAG: TolC family protein [Geobacteraceae bacterium]|nr:TolC family protein [Geobacteraceae bacterium]